MNIQMASISKSIKIKGIFSRQIVMMRSWGSLIVISGHLSLSIAMRQNGTIKRRFKMTKKIYNINRKI